MGYHIQSDPVNRACNPENAWPGFCMQDVGQRFYNPGLGRWINRDPIGERDGPNMYVACGNAPVHKYDLLGALTLSSLSYVARDPEWRLRGPKEGSGRQDNLTAWYAQHAYAVSFFGWPEHGICNSGRQGDAPVPSFVTGWAESDQCCVYRTSCSYEYRATTEFGPTAPGTMGGGPGAARILGHVLGRVFNTFDPAIQDDDGVWRSFVSLSGEVSRELEIGPGRTELYRLAPQVSVGTVAAGLPVSVASFTEVLYVNCAMDFVRRCP